jgi:hypothetical protein
MARERDWILVASELKHWKIVVSSDMLTLVVVLVKAENGLLAF